MNWSNFVPMVAARKILRRLPFRIVRAGNRKINDRGYDALEHNTMRAMEEAYRDPNFVAAYESARRLCQYEEIVALIREHSAEWGILCESIADFGCGPGGVLGKLAECFPDAQLTGFDFSRSAIELARSRLPEQRSALIVQDLYEGVGQQFDVVVCNQTLEHMEHPELVLGNMHSAVRAGGIVVLTVPDGRADTFKGHINFWSEESWNLWLDKNLDSRRELRTGRLTKCNPDVNTLYAIALT